MQHTKHALFTQTTFELVYYQRHAKSLPMSLFHDGGGSGGGAPNVVFYVYK